MRNYILILLIIGITQTVLAQSNDTIIIKNLKLVASQNFRINDHLTYQYDKPKFWEMITKVPKDFAVFGNMIVQKQNLVWLGASLGATVALIPADQQLINESRKFGNQIGFNENHTYADPIKMIPNNINSGIYNIGNGFNMLLIGGGLLTYGLVNDNYRAISTSSQIVEGLINSGLVVQPLKRITGRESPFIADKTGHSGGDWNPFPSFAAYAKHTPNYDAMPSGHLITLMTTVTIIAENYKEKKWIKPVGYSLMGLMSFEMMQSKVHWASDYPLAIFMGYMIGKSIVKGRVTEIKNNPVGEKNNFKPKFNYSFSTNQNYTLAGVNVVF